TALRSTGTTDNTGSSSTAMHIRNRSSFRNCCNSHNHTETSEPKRKVRNKDLRTLSYLGTIADQHVQLGGEHFVHEPRHYGSVPAELVRPWCTTAPPYSSD